MTRYIDRTAYTRRSGLTLIELLVAVALMVMLIAGIGYVFSSTSRTVRVTRNGAEVNTAMRALVAQLQTDFQMLDKNGFMAIVGGADNGAQMCPPMLMFTVTGRFETQRIPNNWTTANQWLGTAELPTNSAVVVYMPVIDSSSPGANSVERRKVLARYVFRLGGRNETLQAAMGESSAYPMFLGQMFLKLLPGAGSSANALSYDWLPASLEDIKHLPARFEVTGPIGDPEFTDNLYEAFVYPLILAFANGNYPEFEVDPSTLTDVEKLWPYLVGGLRAEDTSVIGPECMSVEFYDGRSANGTVNFSGLSDNDKHLFQNDAINDPKEDFWLNLAENIGDLRGSSRNNAPFCVMESITINGMDVPFAIWSSFNKSYWPEMVKFKVQLTDVAGQREKPAAFELIIPVQ